MYYGTIFSWVIMEHKIPCMIIIESTSKANEYWATLNLKSQETQITVKYSTNSPNLSCKEICWWWWWWRWPKGSKGVEYCMFFSLRGSPLAPNLNIHPSFVFPNANARLRPLDVILARIGRKMQELGGVAKRGLSHTSIFIKYPT